jgi:hypothetical protein
MTGQIFIFIMLYLSDIQRRRRRRRTGFEKILLIHAWKVLKLYVISDVSLL